MATRKIADAITDDISELYVLGNPPSSVVAFGSKHSSVDALEVGDAMCRRGWGLDASLDPKSVNIVCTVRVMFLLDILRLIHFFQISILSSLFHVIYW